MKSYLKLLMAMILILSCIAVFASCGDDDSNNDDAGDTSRPDIDIVIPPDSDIDETYRVQFVYRYYLTYINDFDRMESKAFTERKVTLEIPLENSGFSAEQIAQIEGIKHNGYSFMDWYLGWDEDNYSVTGEAFDFSKDNAKITSDMTFYGYRGNLAGENATWAITTEGEGKNQETVLTLSGTGALFDYEAVTNIDIPWYSERSKITKVVIGEGITHVGSNTFNGLYACDDISFPESLTSVGAFSFRGMTKLTALETPKNLKTIGASAFAETALKSLVLNEGLEEISDNAFYESNKITSVIVPSSLKLIKSGAFHPGSVDGKANAHSLKYVYYLGTEEQFKKIDIGLDNAWFNELASVYCKLPEGVDAADAKGPYWDYYSYENGEGETVDTGIPVPYYYMIKYYLNSSTYGVLTPIFVDYARTSVVVNEDGTLSVSAIVDKSNVEFAEQIEYHNFKFVRFVNGVSEGLKLTDDRSVTCEVYLNTRVSPSESAVGVNKGWLSNKGGILWEFSFATRTLTISLGTKVATVENVAPIIAKIADYKGDITGDSVISAILGVVSAAEIAEIAEVVGLSSAEEFAALAEKLATLELSSSTDPLIATAQALAAKGIVTVDDLGAFIAKIDADDADALAVLAELADASLDIKNLNDLYAKLTAAKISGNIADEFSTLSVTLAAFEAKDILITDLHASVIKRETAMEDLAKATVKDFMVGDAKAFDAAITVSDLVAAISELQDAEKLFDTFDYATSEDTNVMWASSRSYSSFVEKVVINDGVKHLGSYLFAGLISVKDIIIPATVDSIDANAFSGCSGLNSVYYAGSDLSAVEIYDAIGGKGKIGNLYQDRILQGHYASAYAYTETAQSVDGKFWMNIGDTKIAWSLVSGELRIGGPSVIYDFETPEAAPWYGAKDSITKVVIARHVTNVGENIAYGYSNVKSLSIGEGFGAVVSIPATAFAGTGIVLDESKYNKNGLLVVDDYLIGYIGNDEFVKVPNYTISIVEGVFDNNENLDRVYIPNTVLGLHPGTFYNNVPTIIFFKGNSDGWNAVGGNLVFPEDAEYYVALSERKSTDNPDFFFLYEQKGDEFIIIDGCIHKYTEWEITINPTCTKEGEKQRSCTGTCGKTFTESVSKLGHNWSAWTACADAPTYEERWCQNENCDAKCSVEGCTVHADHTDDCADDCTAHKQAAHEKVMINSEFTFEGVDSVKDNQIKLSDTTNSKYTIVEIGTDSHAFEYEKLNTGASAEFTVFATQAGNLDTAKVITYKSDLKIDNTNKKVSIDLVFCSEETPSVKSVILNLLSKDGKNLDVGAKSGYGEDAVTGDYVSLGVKTGDWFNLKVEYYADGAASVAKVYVNENLVYITDVFYGSEAAEATPVSAGSVDAVSFVPAANYLGKISLDNVTLVQDNNYNFDGKTTLIEAITFDEIPSASLVKVDGTATIVEKDGNKYYSINRTSSSGYYTFYPASSANSANVAIFETDLQITRKEGSRAWAIRLLGGPSSNAYMAEFRHDANTQTLYVADKSHSQDSIGYKSEYIQPKNAEGTPVDIQVGDWVNVRIEYYEAKAGDAESVRILTYVNDVLVLYSNNWYGVSTEQESTSASGTVPQPAKISEITGAYIQPYTSHRGEWNVDNSIFYTTVKTAPTAPVELKYDDYNGGAIDNSGVIRTDWVQEDDRAKALKNLINEPVDEDEEDIYVPEEDEASKIVTFDDLDAVPAIIAHNSGNGTLTIESDGNNKFFRVTNGSSASRWTMALTEDAVADATSAIFEAKIRYNVSKDGGNGATNLFFTKGNTSDRAFEFQFNYVDGNVMFSTREGTDATGANTTQGDLVYELTDSGIKLNEWFDFKAEYTDAGKLTVSVNGNVVLESENYYTKSAAPFDASEVIGSWFVCFGGTTGNFDFDNFAFYHVVDESVPAPHEHKFVEGKCDCGAEDPDYVPVLIPEGAVTFDSATGFPVTSGNISIVDESQRGASRYTAEDGSKVTVYKNDDGTTTIPQWKGTISLDDGYIRIEDIAGIGTTESDAKDAETAKTADLGQLIMRFNYNTTISGNVAIFQARMRLSPLADGKSNFGASGNSMDLRFNSTGNKNAMAAFLFANGGKVAFADKSNSKATVKSTADVGDWFTITYVYTYDETGATSSAEVIITDKDGVETKANVTTNNAPAADLCRVSLIGNKPFQGILDIDNIFIGEELKYPESNVPDEPVEEEEEEDVLEGTVTFEDYEAGEWKVDANASVIINHINLGQAGKADAIVVDGNNKYLSLAKIKGGTYVDGQPGWQTSMLIQKTMDVPAGTALVFEADMRIKYTKGSSGYLRFYSGADATQDKTTGTLAGQNTADVASTHRNIMLSPSNGKIVIDNSSTDKGFAAITLANSNEWFTLRLVLLDGYITVFVKDETGKFVELGKINRTGWTNFADINAVTFMNDSGPELVWDLDNVYFGPYVADVESPIENLPEKEAELPEGNISFNGIEDTMLPEGIELLTDGDSALGVVAVTRGNKVLYLDKNAGADARVYLNATKKTVGANVLSFATQMYFDKLDAAGYVDVTLMPSGSAEDDRVYKIRISASAEGNLTVATVSLVDGADVVGEAVDTGVAVGEWFKLSVVYSEKDNSFAVAINGENKLSATAAYGMFKDASAISQVLILASDALAADVYFENMSLSQIIAE